MIPGTSNQARFPRVIVVGNEKGGSGKSTVAIHIAVALMKSGESVATIDLDSRQRSFTGYIENRRAWGERIGRDLGIPNHMCLDGNLDVSDADERAVRCKALTDAVVAVAPKCNYVVIDTPGHDSFLVRLAHSMADTLVTPLNDSFVDFDVLGTVDPETFAATGETSHYAQMAQEARSQRELLDNASIDWIVLRNRLSSTPTRNKRFVGDALQDLAQRLGFRLVEGLAERVIFREFYPRGLTAADELTAGTLGNRPTMSHATAQIEVQNLVGALSGRPVEDAEFGTADAA